MYDRRLDSFVPHIYKDVTEMDAIIEAEQTQLSYAQVEASQAFANTFVLTANYEGIEMFEMMLGIIADPTTESVEFRRQRVLNRIALAPPFTFRFLKKKLDDIIGKGAWNAYVDFNNYTLYVESSLVNQQWFNELRITINRIKPCNLVFINKPLIAADVIANETIASAVKHYNYILGRWRLGQKPFVSIDLEEVIKLPNVKSINPNLLTDVATFSATDIVAVRLNGNIKLSDFVTKVGQGTATVVEYEVKPTQTGEITQIELLGTGDRVLTASTVYIPVPEAIICKHTINFKEGE